VTVYEVPKYVIVGNQISAGEREQIQSIVKAKANGWWHSFPDVWIVGGRTVTEWRDLVGAAIINATPSGIMVLKIDNADPTTWAFRARLNEASVNWLRSDLHL
jgi:hypothetical protein